LNSRLLDLVFHLPQTWAPEHQWVEVELEVEPCQLGGEVGVVHRLENLGRERGRPPASIHQEELLLGADTTHVGLEEIILEHLLEGPHVLQEMLEEDPDLIGLRSFPYVLLSHFAPW